MDISALSSALSSSAPAGGSSAKLIDTELGGSRSSRPEEVLSEPTESAQVVLSAFSQEKSAVVEVQVAAIGLQESKQLQSADGAKKAAEAFVKAYNAETRTVASLTRREDVQNSGNAPAGEPSARAASSELQFVVQRSESELKQAGISLQKDGSLAIDTKAFEAAYVEDSGSLRQSLSTVGNRVEPVVTRQLDASGSVGSADSLGSKAVNPEDRQADVQARIDQSQQNVQVKADLFRPGPFATGVSAYKGIFSI